MPPSRGRWWWIAAAAVVVAAGGIWAMRDGDVPVEGYEVVSTWPHDPRAYCQGLAFDGGTFVESTGRRGESSLRRVEIETGEVKRQIPLDAELFGEGVTVFGDRVIQLTYRAGRGFVYDRNTFLLQRTFAYEGEGWGLTHDGERLILSDGTSTLRFLDPASFAVTGTLQVTAGGEPLAKLNELEYIRGEIWANVYQTDRIARISPETGEVLSFVDLRGILPNADFHSGIDVLNGIAYDARNDRLFVTGKNWPRLFEIRVVPKE